MSNIDDIEKQIKELTEKKKQLEAMIDNSADNHITLINAVLNNTFKCVQENNIKNICLIDCMCQKHNPSKKGVSDFDKMKGAYYEKKIGYNFKTSDAKYCYINLMSTGLILQSISKSLDDINKRLKKIEEKSKDEGSG